MKRHGFQYAGAELVQVFLALGYGVFLLVGWIALPWPLYVAGIFGGAFLLSANRPVPPVDPR